MNTDPAVVKYPVVVKISTEPGPCGSQVPAVVKFSADEEPGAVAAPLKSPKLGQPLRGIAFLVPRPSLAEDGPRTILPFL